MKEIIGFILIGIGVLTILFGSFFCLALGIWNIIHGWETLTFFSFLFSIFLIFGRELIVALLGVGLIFGGLVVGDIE